MIICGPVDDPDDPLMQFDNYFGHVPQDFNPSTGRSKTHRQVKVDDDTSPLGYRYQWVPR